MELTITTLKSKDRIKAIKLTADYYCMSVRFYTKNRVSLARLTSTSNSITASKDELLERMKSFYMAIKGRV